MELKDRMKLIINEQHLKQKDFATSIKVTESYISNLLNGKRDGISEPLAFMIQEIYGYSSKWLLTGEGEKYVIYSKDSTLSLAQKRLIADLEKLTEEELIAVRAFMKSLKEMKENKDKIVKIPIAAYGGNGVETKKISSEQLEKLLDDDNDSNKYETELERERKELLRKMLEEE